MKKLTVVVPVLVAFLGANASPEKPNFQDDIIPVFEQSCNSCHNPDKARGGLDLTSMNGIVAGGSSGEVASPGDPDNSLIYTLAARLQEPHMPPRGEKIAKSHLLLIKNWISQGMLPTASGKPMKKKNSSVNLALGSVSIGKPAGPPPMPKYLSVQPYVVTERAFAPSAMSAAPWSPLIALAGQKQVLLFNTVTLKISGILPYPEGFIESLNFSRNGKLIIASGGRGGKSGNVVGWEVDSGRRVLDVGEEQDAILTADISADQSLVAIGGTSKLIKVYDLSTNEILYKIKKHSEWVTQVSFSPDGILLATGDRNGGIHIWEAKTGNPFYSLDGHKKEITSLSWRADGNVLLSASEEGALRTWEMINGKQVKTWNAHNGGALSAHYAKNGNIVSSGRDKSVKFWDTHGKALRTISGFNDIVMESRLSHDGSKIIAGDWTGKVGVWNSADGKLLGHLNTNPPTIQTRIELATNSLSIAEKELLIAKQSLSPFQKKIDQLNARVKSDKQTLNNIQNELQEATKAVLQEKVLLDDSLIELERKTNLQSIKSKLIASISEEIAKKQQTRKSKIADVSKFEKEMLSFSKSLDKSKENLRKAEVSSKQNSHDSNSTQAYNNAKEFVAVAEKKHKLAIEKTATHKTQLKQIDEDILKLSQKKMLANEDLIKLKSEAASALSGKNSKAQSWEKLQQIQSNLTIKKREADSALSESQNLYMQSLEDLKVPASDVTKANNKVNISRTTLSRWKAELINTERHSKIKELNELNQELKEYSIILEEAEKIKESALRDLNATQKSFQLLPSEIALVQKLILEKKKSHLLAENKHNLSIQLLEKKKAFLSNLNSIAETSKGVTLQQKPESTLKEANSKLIDALNLFKKDLTDSQNKLASLKGEILIAKQAVKDAEKKEQEKLVLQKSIPNLIAQKKQSYAEASQKYLIAEKEYKSIVSKIDAQTEITNDLLSKYTNLLAIKD